MQTIMSSLDSYKERAYYLNMDSDKDQTQEQAQSGPSPIDPEGVAELRATAPSAELIAVVSGTTT